MKSTTNTKIQEEKWERKRYRLYDTVRRIGHNNNVWNKTINFLNFIQLQNKTSNDTFLDDKKLVLRK